MTGHFVIHMAGYLHIACHFEIHVAGYSDICQWVDIRIFDMYTWQQFTSLLTDVKSDN